MEKGRGLGRASFENEVMVKLSRDLEILSSKLSDVRGTASTATTSTTSGQGQKQAIAVVSSSFVSGIRKATEVGNPGDDRLSILDRIVEKVTEYDREILKKTATADASISRTREDLTSLPTHLHITDRLLDLFAQTQRLRNVPANDQMQAESQRQIARLETKMASIVKQLSDSEEKTLAAQAAVKQNKVELTQLQQNVATSESTIEALRKELEAATKAATTTIVPSSPNNNLTKELEGRNRHLEDLLKVSTETNQFMVAAVLEAAKRIESSGGGVVGLDLPVEGVSGDGRKALEMLTTVIANVAEQRSAALINIQREKESAHTRWEGIQKDHALLLASHEELKREVSSLRFDQDRIRREEEDRYATKIKEMTDEMEQLQQALTNALNRIAQLEQGPPELEDALNKLVAKDLEIESIKFDFTQLSEELMSYKKLADSMKVKLRDMGAKDNVTPSFMDSYEEVMKDEMMAMKWAFESKLRVAKEKYDAMNQKHQQEIRKLQYDNTMSGKTTGPLRTSGYTSMLR